MWADEPWQHDVLLTVEERRVGELDRLFAKAALMARAGRRVFVLVATARKWQALRRLGCAGPLHIPPGGVAWGDAVGWPDGATGRDGERRATHSCARGRAGVPTAGACEDVRAQRRHAVITNGQAVWGLLFETEPEVGAEALSELAYTLAGVGGQTGAKWPTWRSRGAAPRPLGLAAQPLAPWCDPLRPLRHCAWQGLEALPAERVASGAGPTDEATQQARMAAASLRALGVAAEGQGGMVPDGVVPTQLRHFLTGVGVRAGEATEGGVGGCCSVRGGTVGEPGTGARNGDSARGAGAAPARVDGRRWPGHRAVRGVWLCGEVALLRAARHAGGRRDRA